MAKYEVIHAFTDLQDSRTVYNVGDEYPRKGVHPSEERISETSWGCTLSMVKETIPW